MTGSAFGATARVRLMTLNMHKGFSAWGRNFILHELRDAIRQSNSEVVLLQEVLGVHREHSTRWERWPRDSQYEFLADTVWSAHAYGKNAAYPEGHHGNALLSKYPIVHQRNHDISIDGVEARGLLHCILDVPGWPKGLHTICVHLGLSTAQRSQQLKQLCAMIQKEVPIDTPLVVAGDFNDWRQQAHASLAEEAGLHEVFVSAFGRAARSFPAWLPLLRLDRIYVRNLAVSAPRVLDGLPWRRLSDHNPLALELAVPS